MIKTIQRLFFEYEKEGNTTCISLSVPFIFKLILTKHMGLQGALSIRFLIFSFYVGLYFGLRWGVSQILVKWMWSLRIHLKRVLVTFTVGIPLYFILEWRTNRLIRKLTPERKERLRKILEFVIKR